MTEPSGEIQAAVKQAVNSISQEVKSRAFRSANELRNATMEVLRGQRSGRMYTIPGTHAKYQASAPGEPPAVRTGTFRNAWQQRTYTEGQDNGMLIHAVVENEIKVKDEKLLGRILEEGAPKAHILPRPYKQKVIDMATPKIQAICAEPYHI